MKTYLLALLLLLLCSCTPNDNSSDYRKCDVMLLSIDAPTKIMYLLVDGTTNLKCRYNRDTFGCDWLTIVRSQYSYPHFTLLIDNNNNLYRL